MFQCENPSCGNPGSDLRSVTLVPVTAEDRLDRSDQGITHWRKKATELCSGVTSGSQQQPQVLCWK